MLHEIDLRIYILG